jgi:hypothetical protein
MAAILSEANRATTKPRMTNSRFTAPLPPAGADPERGRRTAEYCRRANAAAEAAKCWKFEVGSV